MTWLLPLLLVAGMSISASDRKTADDEDQSSPKQQQRRTSVTRTRTGNKPLKIKMPKQKLPKLKKTRRL